jgi:hypothetical protein
MNLRGERERERERERVCVCVDTEDRYPGEICSFFPTLSRLLSLALSSLSSLYRAWVIVRTGIGSE